VGPYTLRRLDPLTLRVATQNTLTNSDSDIAARPDGVYVADGDRLERRDPITLAIRNTVALPSHDRHVSLATDPGTNVLWVALYTIDPQITVLELQLPGLSVQQKRTDILGTQPGQLLATADSAWLSFPTGNFGRAIRLTNQNAATVAQLDEIHQNAAGYALSGRHLWDLDNLTGLTCANVTTGAAQGNSLFAAGPFATADRQVFVAEGPKVRVLRPIGGCQ
jgi:hypothetical protein